jgi:hypothetical protein
MGPSAAPLWLFGSSWGEREAMGAAKGVWIYQKAARKAILWCFFAVLQVQSRGIEKKKKFTGKVSEFVIFPQSFVKFVGPLPRPWQPLAFLEQAPCAHASALQCPWSRNRHTRTAWSLSYPPSCI